MVLLRTKTLFLTTDMSSSLYDRIYATATEAIHSLDRPKNPLIHFDEDRLRAIRSPTFKASWGHKYMARQNPVMSQELDFDGFVRHLNRMAPALEMRDNRIQDIWVDVNRRSAIVSALLTLKVEGVEGIIEQDMLWVMRMNEDGSLVDHAIEYLDGLATEKLRTTIVDRP